MCNSKLCIFAGTTEGRRLAEQLANQPIEITLCVATEYGENLLPKAENLHTKQGRLSKEDMEIFLTEENFVCVVDATHPYAEIVTENISAVCEKINVKYIRLLREDICGENVICVSSASEAADYLKNTVGNILLTTGSKELSVFQNLVERCYARVLPMEDSLKLCKNAKISPSHIIAMQGPFSKEMNVAQIKSCNAKWLVTKEGGRSGGFTEKIEAADETKTKVIMIGRPHQKQGMNYLDVLKWISKYFNLNLRPQVNIVGIGPGNLSAMTEEVRYAIQNSDCLIGANRMLELAKSQQLTYEAIMPEKISDFIHIHSEFQKITVLMSGDTGFFSGTKKLLPLLSDCDVKILPGLSSLSYLCAKLGKSYEDVRCVSVHGRDYNLIPDVKKYPRVFTVVSGENGIGVLCEKLTAAGLGSVKVSVGECLSYENEKITVGTAEELAKQKFHSLSAALIENSMAKNIITHGLPDEFFQRGNAADGSVVPMTKMEVRSVSLSKLQLTENSVCWDIGAGSGAVAIEMALQTNGMVYAIEKKDDAVELMKENRRKFAVNNLEIISGLAPQICEELPAPTHVFIGGSSGNMREIIDCILSKNPHTRIVATAIALETVAELTACMKMFDFAEVIQLSSARSRKAGPYHLMTAQNPIHIFTFQKGQ